MKRLFARLRSWWRDVLRQYHRDQADMHLDSADRHIEAQRRLHSRKRRRG